MYFAVTRVAYGWVKTLLGLAVFYGVIAVAMVIVRRLNANPASFAPFCYMILFGCWLAVTVLLSRRGSRIISFFMAVLCGAHQLAMAIVCYALMSHVESKLLSIVTVCGLMMAMGVGMIWFVLPRVRQLSRSVDWWILNVVVCILLALIYTTGFWPIWAAGASLRGAIPFIVAVLALVSFFPMVFDLSEMTAASVQLQQVEDHTRVLMAELRSARASEEGARRVRHDARHHISVVREMLAAGRVKETDEYLANLADHEVLGSSGMRRWCENALVDALLAVADRKATASGRRLVAMADVSAVFPLSETDLVALFGNLFENAILHGAPGDVHVLVVLSGGNVLRLSVANAVAPGFTLVNGLPTEVEGVGITSVRRVVEKYHGVMGYEVEGERLVCKVVIGCV